MRWFLKSRCPISAAQKRQKSIWFGATARQHPMVTTERADSADDAAVDWEIDSRKATRASPDVLAAPRKGLTDPRSPLIFIVKDCCMGISAKKNNTAAQRKTHRLQNASNIVLVII
jgi:hypothetical protein